MQQSHEWLAIDRPLSDQELAEVSSLSSHISVSARGAWVEYHWSDFGHDPLDVLVRYFDAFIYVANWGSRQLAFRLPAKLMDPWPIQPYVVEPYIDLITHDQYQVLSIDLNDEEPTVDWIEPAGLLARLASVRDDILRGDFRLLYLAWLQAVELDGGYEIADDEPEPPVPPGLDELTAALHTFVDWVELDPHLLASAASASRPLVEHDTDTLDAAIGNLSRQECDGFLRRLLRDEPLLSLALRRRLQEFRGGTAAPPMPPRRRVAELLESRASRMEEAGRRIAEAERARHVREMDDLAPREESIWHQVEHLLATSYQPVDYDSAVADLVRLRQLATHLGTLSAFQARMDELALKYRRRPSLQDRFRKAQLIGRQP